MWKTVWMKVSSDKYELPEVIADSAVELAKMLNVSANSISSSIQHARVRGSRTVYKKVMIDEEGDNDSI